MTNHNLKFYDVLIDVLSEDKAARRFLGLETDEVEMWLRAARVVIHEGAVDTVMTDNIGGAFRVFEKLYPLYEHTWIETIFQPDKPEYRTRAGVLIASAKWDKGNNRWHKAVKDLPKLGIDPDELGWVLNLEAFLEVDDIPAYLATAVVFVHKDGGNIAFTVPGYEFKQPYGFARHDLTFALLQKDSKGEITSDTYNAMCHTLFESALYTVDFVHRHKNIALEQVEMNESRQVRRARARAGKAPLKPYHVIKITTGKGKGETIGARGSIGTKHAPARVHSVIGHTRDYPDGLFGNPDLAGEWFIPSHMRGNRGKGQVDKHHEVIEGNNDGN